MSFYRTSVLVESSVTTLCAIPDHFMRTESHFMCKPTIMAHDVHPVNRFIRKIRITGISIREDYFDRATPLINQFMSV